MAGLALFVATVLASGCGKPGTVPTAQATGVVKLNGQPLKGVIVGFVPEHGRPGQGTTDASGRFAISTFTSQDGAVAGKHKVVVAEPPKAAPGSKVEEEAAAAKGGGSRVPAEYSDAAKTPLEATVAMNAKNEFEFDLKGQPARMTSVPSQPAPSPSKYGFAK
jgi:hypothetical protein